jgi:hypothetical protein
MDNVFPGRTTREDRPTKVLEDRHIYKAKRKRRETEITDISNTQLLKKSVNKRIQNSSFSGGQTLTETTRCDKIVDSL